ncbi:hypothetical protein JL720_7198 [Aureococcus anophagefferens]|nr:hypothetical protein JL720_7198 [Aureococcus anophagefferens]
MKVQIFVACLILANFIVSATARTFGGSIVEKQVWPSGQICDLKSHDCLKDTKCNCRAVTRRYKRIFTGFGACFNYIFSVAAGAPLARWRAARRRDARRPAPIARPTAQVELCWNMYAHWFWLFWGDGWNVFDFITVAVGWITEVGIELPGPLGMLRMVRALRVFRLFKRVKSLRKILESLARRAGRATRFWVDNFDGTGLIGDVPPGARGEWLAHHEKQVDGAGTYYAARQRVLTGDSWAEAIGRPLLEGWFPMSTALFFVSFILLHSVVLINAVAAVLLEKMARAPRRGGSRDKRGPMQVTPDDEEEEEGARPRTSSGPRP